VPAVPGSCWKVPVFSISFHERFHDPGDSEALLLREWAPQLPASFFINGPAMAAARSWGFSTSSSLMCCGTGKPRGAAAAGRKLLLGSRGEAAGSCCPCLRFLPATNPPESSLTTKSTLVCCRLFLMRSSRSFLSCDTRLQCLTDRVSSPHSNRFLMREAYQVRSHIRHNGVE
jgi:hypothetical protein